MLLFFFKQKTAYEMRISDWSSDVCSSDLVERGVIAQTRGAYAAWQANERFIAATRQAVSANALSLEGVRAENSVGTRSILDILNAEQAIGRASCRERVCQYV